MDISSHSDFAEQVFAAVASHGRWKKRLVAAIEAGDSEWTPEEVRDCHQCRFGHWLDSVPDGFQDDMFVEVFKLHERFHEAAADVLALALSGDKAAAAEAMAVGSDYARASTKLITVLAKWHASPPS